MYLHLKTFRIIRRYRHTYKRLFTNNQDRQTSYINIQDIQTPYTDIQDHQTSSTNIWDNQKSSTIIYDHQIQYKYTVRIFRVTRHHLENIKNHHMLNTDSQDYQILSTNIWAHHKLFTKYVASFDIIQIFTIIRYHLQYFRITINYPNDIQDHQAQAS